METVKKILLIGQAPAAVEQRYPYDTTFLYQWLSEVGITVEQAQELFDFEAVYGSFTGHGKGGHIKPTVEQMNSHWESTLKAKVEACDKIVFLGNVSKEYILNSHPNAVKNKQVYACIHPSRRNHDRIIKDWDGIINLFRHITS